MTLVDGSGHSVSLIDRPLSTFESEKYLVVRDHPERLALPLKSTPQELIDGRLIVSIDEDWTAAGATFKQGSLVALDLAAVRADPAHLKPTLIYQPAPREAFDQASATRDRLVVTTFDNVRGRAFVYTPAPSGGWTHTKLDLPDNAAVGIVDTDNHSNKAFISVTGFLTPIHRRGTRHPFGRPRGGEEPARQIRRLEG